MLSPEQFFSQLLQIQTLSTVHRVETVMDGTAFRKFFITSLFLRHIAPMAMSTFIANAVVVGNTCFCFSIRL